MDDFDLFRDPGRSTQEESGLLANASKTPSSDSQMYDFDRVRDPGRSTQEESGLLADPSLDVRESVVLFPDDCSDGNLDRSPEKSRNLAAAKDVRKSVVLSYGCSGHNLDGSSEKSQNLILSPGITRQQGFSSPATASPGGTGDATAITTTPITDSQNRGVKRKLAPKRALRYNSVEVELEPPELSKSI